MKSLAELRKMSTQELSDFFDIFEDIAGDVKSGLNESYYVSLADKSLTSKERAEQLGLTKKTVENYRSALLKVGLAERKIDRIPYKSDYSLILKTITKPITFSELEAKTNIIHHILLKEVKQLKRVGRLYEFKLVTGRIASTSFCSRDLFGELTNVKYLYKRGQERAAARTIAEKLPIDRLYQSKPMRVSLTSHLKNRLPADIFNHLYKFYHPK